MRPRRNTRRGIACGALLVACGAACSGGGATAPTLDYGGATLRARQGEPVTWRGTNSVGSGFAVAPDLPAGLTLDAADGTIRGTPTSPVAEQQHTITGRLGDTTVAATVRIAVGAALPPEVVFLEAGFAMQRHATLTLPPAKMAIAPDGRIFVTELASGVVRIVGTDGSLQATPFATVPVVTGGHRGLLGIALSPAFATDGRVFAMAVTPANGSQPERSVLYRWREVGGIGVDQTVLLDDLPAAVIDNGGALAFDGAGMLLVTIGDTEDPAAAQSDASYAGKVLRIDPETGAAAAGNPVAGNRIHAKGLRNPFAMALDPATRNVFLADNGPATDDELDLLQPGRNYEWGAAIGEEFGALTGARLRLWPEVVVPTGLAFADAADARTWPAEHERSLYVALYDEEVVQRFELSGSQRTDIDREVEFVRFAASGVANKPLDVQRGPDGTLWLLTFTGIYRIDLVQ